MRDCKQNLLASARGCVQTELVGLMQCPAAKFFLVRGTSATSSPAPPPGIRLQPDCSARRGSSRAALFASPPLLTSHFPIPVTWQLNQWWGRWLAGLCADQVSFLGLSSWLPHATALLWSAFVAFLPQILCHAALLVQGAAAVLLLTCPKEGPEVPWGLSGT